MQPTFQIIYKHPFSRSFLLLRLLSIYECNTKSYLRHSLLLNKVVCFPSMIFFPALIFYLFLLKCSDTHLFSLRPIIYWNKNDVLKKKKLLRLYISKTSNKNNKGIVQSENIWRCFRVPNDNFEQVSQITAMCLWPTLSIYCMVFIKQLFFLFVDILTHIFIALWLQQMSKVLKATVLQRDNSFFFGKFFFSNFDKLQLKRFVCYCFEIFSQAS